MKKAGNALMALVGGREVHPINVRVGGFYRAPTRRRAARAASSRSSGRARPRSRPSRWAADAAVPRRRARARAASRCSDPDALPDRPRADRLRPRAGHRAGGVRRAHRRGARRALQRAARPPARARHLPDRPARALQPRLASAAAAGARGGARGRARERPAATRSRASSCARSSSCRPATRRWRSSTRYEQPDAPAVEVHAAPRGRPRRDRGAARACSTTATRSTSDGTILDATIVPPTSQNQLAIEEDLRAVVERHLDLPDEELHAAAASRRSATTIRASPAPPTSSS